ncbi:hypothetical protein AXG93_763s1340 [Marchantia polymorpha subsp. ruderalis]|uniref:Uncharacterized protein n=1 Tax=Marchantia polymorpha subsp. ruderalis TaxID=1480154 RepID=A0A176WPQ7_MARPO|nr:hypothetical protein AXG93_763s1340 [Marchantia polymorpha subsp. ruderalis]
MSDSPERNASAKPLLAPDARPKSAVGEFIKSFRSGRQMEGGRARATSPGEQERLGRRHTLRGFLPGAEEHEKIEAERSLGPGIHFYPSTSVAKIGDFKDEEDCIQEANRFQPSGLDPTVIFKKVDENDAKLAPEQNITLFALRLAMIEKAASGIGTLSFIWASTIILGGFASNINPSDFLVVTIILITEGTRIFTRSRELEWQHVTSKSTDTLKFHKPDKPDKPDRRTLSRQDRLPKDDVRWQDGLPARERAAAAAAANAVALPHPDPGEKRTVAPLEREADEDEAFPKAPKGASPENPEREKIQRLRLGSLSAKSIKRTWTAQVVPMIPCGFHSILTTRGDFNPEGTPPDETPVNLFWSVNIFYALALTEAALFLLERAYWEWKISVQKLLVDVNDRLTLLKSDNTYEQLGGAREEMRKECPGESGDGAGASQTLALRLDGLRILVALTRDSMDGIELKIFKKLQWMAIEILTNLALDDSIRRAIGSTGGVIRILFHIHTRHLNYMRSGENSKNSLRMLDLKDSTGGRPFIPALIELLNEHREHTICAAKILRSLMEIMKLVMESRSHKMQEAVLLANLEHNCQASSKFPRIRRHSIEFIVVLSMETISEIKRQNQQQGHHESFHLNTAQRP